MTHPDGLDKALVNLRFAEEQFREKEQTETTRRQADARQRDLDAVAAMQALMLRDWPDLYPFTDWVTEIGDVAMLAIRVPQHAPFAIRYDRMDSGEWQQGRHYADFEGDGSLWNYWGASHWGLTDDLGECLARTADRYDAYTLSRTEAVQEAEEAPLQRQPITCTQSERTLLNALRALLSDLGGQPE